MPFQTPGQAWRLLAQIPEVAHQEAEKTTARVSAATKDPVYRFDLPELPQPHAPAETVSAGRSATHTIGPRRPGVSHRMPDASGLPLWAHPLDPVAGVRPHPLSKGENRGQTWVGSVVRFLLLVALFTAAGVSIRMMNTARNEPSTTPIEVRSPAVDRSAAAAASTTPVLPTSPLAESPAKQAAPASTAAESLQSRAIRPSTVAVDEPPVERYADGNSVTLVYPKALRPAPLDVETLEAEEGGVLAPNQSSAIAQLPGYILEIPPHQAQHDQEESHVH